jgi:hypothetical protein
MSDLFIPYDIDSGTKGRTECPYDFECLSSGNWQTCAVESSLGEDFVVIKKCAKTYCSHAMTFGYSYYLCKCPTRCKLFRLHHK